MAKPQRARVRAPEGDIRSYEPARFESDGFAHTVYRKGQGPAVIVIAEIPGITPHVLGFADRLVALGFTAVLPDLFGTAGRDPYEKGNNAARLYAAGVVVRICVRREFTLFALGKSSPIVTWLRSLARSEHARCGGPGVGAVGMCLTGGFALAMASDPSVLAPVLSQPSLPADFGARYRYAIDSSAEELQQVAARCRDDGLKVLGVRFKRDPFSPGARFAFLRERLGDGFISVELPANSGHPDSYLPRPHSVLTGDLIDEPGEPTREALEQVITFFRERLLNA